MSPLRNLCFLFILIFIAGCQKELSTELGQKAAGSLQSVGGECLTKKVTGAFIAGKAVADSAAIEVELNITRAGTLNLSTDTVNGYWFKGTGNVTTAGVVTVKLKGGGKPILQGTDVFTLRLDSSECTVQIQVLPAGATGGPAGFTLQGAGGTCMTANVLGTYSPGTALTASNKVEILVKSTRIGTYTVTTNNVNGISFAGTGVLADTGIQTITLFGAGTPLAKGSFNYTVTAGASTCSFSVKVDTATTTPPGGGGTTPITSTDLFPLTNGNTWTYWDKDDTTDTYTVTSSGTAVVGGKTYNKFTDSDGGVSYFRKDAAGNYYTAVDTADFDLAQAGLKFNTATLEINFLKQPLNQNASWSTDLQGTLSGLPVTIRLKFVCETANSTLAYNGRSFSKVYKIAQTMEVGPAGFLSPVPGYKLESWYAQGVGLVQNSDGTFTTQLGSWNVK